MDSKITRAQLNNFDLHQYALLGDDEGVRRALQNGANINALDSAGRTAIMCAVAGEKWHEIDAYDASFMSPKRLNALKIMLQHPQITLRTLNATHSAMNGVIALGMAAWLNQVDAVCTLLDDSSDGVSVDGMDAHGATALMYAARDGNIDVVRALLSRGARPDFRDRNHRTSVQFSMAYPQILWLCETTLRHHRWRESNAAERTRLSTQTEYLVGLTQASLVTSTTLEPPPVSLFTPDALIRMTNTLISCIRSGDLSFLHSVLFSPSLSPASPPSLYPLSVPVLVNYPDVIGWGLVHHCVASPQPSIDILDALYCAGADICLFTTNDQQTPLHILARTARNFSGNADATRSLHDFCIHLIQDLRAPLSARDGNDETCLHIAAEHGLSVDLLLLLLDCDTTGNVRKMRNSRGLTPSEVCKAEFAFAFGSPNDGARPESALSNYTIRPTQSFASLSSVSETHVLSFAPPNTPAASSSFETSSFPALPSPVTDTSSIIAPMDIDVDALGQQLLASLRATSVNTSHSRTSAHIMDLQAHINDTSEQCDLIVRHYRGRIEDAARVVEELEQAADRIGEVCKAVCSASKKQILTRGIKAVPCRRRARDRDSEDSQATIAEEVSSDEVEERSSAPSSTITASEVVYATVGTQTTLLDRFIAANPTAHPDSTWVDDLLEASDSAADTSRARLTGLWAVERDLEHLQRSSAPGTPTPLTTSSNSNIKVGMKLKQVLRKKKKLEEQIQALDADAHARTMKKDASTSSTARVKAWIRRMVGPYPPVQLELVYDLDSSNVGRDAKNAKGDSGGNEEPEDVDACISPMTRDFQDVSMDMALKTSQVVLEAARRDLLAVNDCLQSAHNFIDMANHSISRTQRVTRRAIKKRQALLESLRSTSTHTSIGTSPGISSRDDAFLSPGLLGYDTALSQRPSLASISTIYSTASTISSIGAATVTESDDEDIKIIRRILLRKIDAQMSGIWDEVDTSNSWLHIVKESVRSVKRRAYL